MLIMSMYRIILLCISFGILVPTKVHADESVPDPQSLSRFFMDTVKNDMPEFQKIATDVAASCVDEVFNPKNWEAITNELTAIGGGLGVLSADWLASKALKGGFLSDVPAYPNICHVMYKSHFKIHEMRFDSGKRDCLGPKVGGECAGSKWDRKHPQFSYYWPKYFIEVSEKGNDSHPAFSENNLIYKMNRLVAETLSEFIDVQGIHAIVSAITIGGTLGGDLATKVIKETTKQAVPESGGLDMAATNKQVESWTQSIFMTPLEKLRIRASQKTDQPIYDANIWPVHLSQNLFERLSMCGGKALTSHPNPENEAKPPPGLPMLAMCPLAMSVDAFPYWDSGFLDYINLAAVKGMLTSSNPLTCAAENVASQLNHYDVDHELGERQSESAEGEKKLSNTLGNLGDMYKELKLCSWPIMGPAEAMLLTLDGQTSEKGSFKGPWCTIWGPSVPRFSSSPRRNEYSFVNAALKWKLLSHDLYGVPRGNKERWTLAYPWEGQDVKKNNKFLELFGKLKNVLADAGLDVEALDIDSLNPWGDDKEASTTPTKGDDATETNSRSEILMITGDPRLTDLSTDFSMRKSEVENFLKEIAYMMALVGAGELSANATKQALEKAEALVNEIKKALGIPVKKSPDANGEVKSQDDILSEHKKEIEETEEQSKELGEEIIYEKQYFCHQSQRETGLTGNASIVPGPGGVGEFTKKLPSIDFGEHNKFTTRYGRQYNFSKFPPAMRSQCLNTYTKNMCAIPVPRGSCRSDREKNWVGMIWYEKMVEVGRRPTRNPKAVKYETKCEHVTRSYVEVDKAFYSHWVCKDELVSEEDLSKKTVDVDEPDPNDPGKTAGIDKDSEGGKIFNEQAKELATNAARGVTYVGAEIARLKYEQMSGKSFLRGNKRVYTIWEEVSCVDDSIHIMEKKGPFGTISRYQDADGTASGCAAAVRYKIRAYFLEKFMRRFCDDVLKERLGEPFQD